MVQAVAFLSGMQATMQAMQADMLQYQEQSMQALAALTSRVAQVCCNDTVFSFAASLHGLDFQTLNIHCVVAQGMAMSPACTFHVPTTTKSGSAGASGLPQLCPDICGACSLRQGPPVQRNILLARYASQPA